MKKPEHFYYQVVNYNHECFKPIKELSKEEFCTKFDKNPQEYDNTKLLVDIVQNLSDFTSNRINEIKLSFTTKQELLEFVIEELNKRV